MELYSNREAGFTLAEIVVVVAIIAIMATVTMVGFQNFNRSAVLKTATQEVSVALTSARTSTLSSEADTVYGVHMSTTSVTKFVGSTYAAGASTNETYTFEGGVTATSSLIATNTDVVFARLTGEPSAVGTIYIVNSALDSTTTVTIHASGLVE